MKRTIDINCDVGEGLGNEAVLFPNISSCNIACGGHAGNELSIGMAIDLAQQYNVKLGAHPSYPDRENFGRLSLEISDLDLIKSIQGQLQTFAKICQDKGGVFHHIKPHGALYNDITKNKQLAAVFLRAMAEYKAQVCLFVPYGSVIEKLAIKQGFNVKREAFADRNYTEDLSLVSRKHDNALITTGPNVLEHLLIMFNEHKVKTINGDMFPIKADTYCIHGDTPAASDILAYLTMKLSEYNIQVAS